MRNKKILGLLLAGVMVTSIPFNVFAEGEQPAEGAGETLNPTAQGEQAKPVGKQAGDQNGADEKTEEENKKTKKKIKKKTKKKAKKKTKKMKANQEMNKKRL